MQVLLPSFPKKKKSVDISVPVFYISVYLCIFSGEISKCRDINYQKNKILLLSSRNFRPKQSPFDATNWHLTVKHFFFFFHIRISVFLKCSTFHFILFFDKRYKSFDLGRSKYHWLQYPAKTQDFPQTTPLH